MTNAEARFNNSLRPWKPKGSLGRIAQDVHLDSHTAPELCVSENSEPDKITFPGEKITGCSQLFNLWLLMQITSY